MRPTRVGLRARLHIDGSAGAGRASLVLLAAFGLSGGGACGRRPLALEAVEPAGADAAAASDGPLVAQALPAHCTEDRTPARQIECTGLYRDLATKEIAAGVFAYAPAVVLWSDGSDKQRWISLPPGTKIDASNPNEWKFPVGTKLWKEFSVGGRRIETRLWQKVRDGFWVAATYAWNAAESGAAVSPGGDVQVGNGTYHIPTRDECERCHRGRTEQILGFDQVSLGLRGAAGLTLAALVDRDLIAPAPASTTLTIGDDGTGAAAPALGWLHANCGTTCHNDNPSATAYGVGMKLRLDPRNLDGRDVSGFDPIRTTVGVPVNAANWRGQPRIAIGDPAASVLHELISHRGEGRQMPPIGSRIVDEANVARIAEWIRRMGAAGRADAKAPAAPVADPTTFDAGAAAVRDAAADTEVPSAAADDGRAGDDASTDAL